MTTLITLTNRGQITVPVTFRKQLGLVSDSQLLLSIIDEEIRLKPLPKMEHSFSKYFSSVSGKKKRIDPDLAIKKAKQKKAHTSYARVS